MENDDLILIRREEAARRLSISEKKLYLMSAPRGPIPTVQLGGRVLYSPADIQEAIEGLKKRLENKAVEETPSADHEATKKKFRIRRKLEVRK